MVTCGVVALGSGWGFTRLYSKHRLEHQETLALNTQMMGSPGREKGTGQGESEAEKVRGQIKF